MKKPSANAEHVARYSRASDELSDQRALSHSAALD